MNFVSYEFLVFFALVLAGYYALPHRGQNLLLLVASYVFYGWWDWRFLGLMLGSSVLDYLAAQAIAWARRPDAPRPGWARAALVVSLVGNLGALGLFKYYNFFVDSFVTGLAACGWTPDVERWNVILPVGISFYTFQTMSYTLDVYRGHLPAIRSPLDFLLYVSLFPQLVAGPIERAVDLLPQVCAPRQPTLDGFYSGAQLALVGFVKKLVVADNLAPLVDRVFAVSEGFTGPEVLLAAYAFALQIYCDFSGYSDIARGVARMLGFQLSVNFRHPYFATNPSDFWRRWHISLSTWLRDYLYIPLGGSRHGKWLTYRNLLLTMVLGGMWHGAAWTFVLWGAFHGLILAAWHAWTELCPAPRPAPAARRGWATVLAVVAFFHVTCAGWLLFRARDAAQLRELIAALTTWDAWTLPQAADLLPLVVVGVPLVALEYAQFRSGDDEPWRRWSLPTRTVAYVAAWYALLICGAPHTQAFIYFQF